MKKILYIAAFAIVTMFSVSSCTEENVKPQTGETGGGGVSEDPLKR